MLKKYILFVLLFSFSNYSWCKDFVLSTNFVLSRNAIILKIKSKQNQYLNILFDSASDDFLLDSSVFSKMGLKKDHAIIAASFTNGSVPAHFFYNQEIFSEQQYNDIFNVGKVLNLSLLKKFYGVRIDGLMGINKKIDLCYRLDFFNKKLIISNRPFFSDDHYTKIKMISSDFQYESKRSSMFAKKTAVSGKLFFTKKDSVSLNFIFDTGFNRSFNVFSKLPIDSLIQIYKLNSKAKKERKTSLGTDLFLVYDVKVNAIHLSNFEKIHNYTIKMSKVFDYNFIVSGTSDWYGLIGMDYMKTKKEICFDLLSDCIYILEK